MGRQRGAVFGCGMISEFHLRAWNRIPEVEIVALGNRTLSRAKARRDEFAPSANVYEDLSQLIAHEELDFLDVLTPPSLHKQHCIAAMNAGLNVICQKPIAATLEEAQEMIAVADQTGRSLSIHENHRYRPWYQEILRRSRDGFFGTVRYARFEQFDPQEPLEAYKVESRRGVLLEYGTHIVDMIHALLGVPVTIAGSAHRLNSRVYGESLVHLALAYSDANAYVDIAWKPAGIAQGSVLIVGDRGEAIYKGTMTRGDNSRFRLIEQGRVIVDETRSPYDDYVDSFYHFQRDVVNAWLRREPVPQPATENRAVLETTFAAYHAIDSGQFVPLKRV